MGSPRIQSYHIVAHCASGLFGGRWTGGFADGHPLGEPIHGGAVRGRQASRIRTGLFPCRVCPPPEFRQEDAAQSGHRRRLKPAWACLGVGLDLIPTAFVLTDFFSGSFTPSRGISDGVVACVAFIFQGWSIVRELSGALSLHPFWEAPSTGLAPLGQFNRLGPLPGQTRCGLPA